MRVRVRVRVLVRACAPASRSVVGVCVLVYVRHICKCISSTGREMYFQLSPLFGASLSLAVMHVPKGCLAARHIKHANLGTDGVFLL